MLRQLLADPSFVHEAANKTCLCLFNKAHPCSDRNIIPSSNALFIIIITLLISSFSAAFAQNDTLKLDEFEVYGLKPDQTAKTLSPTQVLSAKQLQSIPSTNVADAIRNFSGVVIKDFGGIGGLKTVMVRSMGANHTGVFMDGLSTGDVATGQIDLGKIPLQEVGNIQLSIGQPEFSLKSARMYASASILDIRSKEPDFTNSPNIINASFRAGSFATINPSISIDSKLSSRSTTGLRLNYYHAKGDFPYEIHNGSTNTNLERTNSDIVGLNGAFKANVLLNDSSTLRLKINYYDAERGLPGAVIFYNTHSSQRLVNRDLVLGLQFENNHTRRIRSLTSLGVSSNLLRYTDPDFLNQTGGIDNKYVQSEYYLSQAVTLPLIEKLNLSIASDIIHNSLTTNAYSVDNPKRLTSLTVASLNYALNNSSIQASVLLTALSDNQGIETSNYMGLSPGVSLIHPVTHDQSLKMRFMYKNIFRMPTFNDLYYSLIGNNNLEPERASLYNAGLIFEKSIGNSTALSLKTDFFMNSIKDKIVTVPTRNLFVWSTQNIGKVEILGVELSASFLKHVGANWSVEVSGNYTYQDARDVTSKSADNYGDQIAYIPFETAGGLITLLYHGFGMGINTIYNGYRYSSSQNGTSSLLEAWTTTDITFSWFKKYHSREYGIKAEIANALNTQYEVVRGFPMTGRAFYINFFVTL